MARRACLGPGKGQRCPTGALTDKPRCPACARVLDRARGTRQERGYDAAHDALGRDYQARMDAGERFNCWRCDTPLGPRRGIDWHLGHDDHDRTIHRGPECAPCNLSTAARRG